MSWLHLLNLVAGASLGMTWLFFVVAARRGLNSMPELAREEYSAPEGAALPKVSILVPARNEQAMIERSVRSLLAIDFPNYELIVVNDRSEDRTGEILDRLREEVGERLVVIHIHELPAGWLGKTHAMWKATQQATGEWLLFTDADIVHHPQALRRAVAYAEAEQAAHIVLLPTMEMHSMGERMMISFFQAMFIFPGHRPWKVRDPASQDVLGVGAFNMVRRAAYEQIGTYESMRLSVVDDMRLAEKVKRAGMRSVAVFGTGLVCLRWAVGATGVMRNLTKNFFAELKYSVPFVMGAAVAILWLHLGPWLGIFFSSGWARAGYAAAMVSLLAIYIGMGRRTKISPAYLLLHPVATLLMVATMLISTVLTLGRGGVMWRGTFYPLAELRRSESR
jgi:cellulose synthase/poly-beta-1,6-N-acetylglucosamine synthase-like glycosyltransferase